MRGDLEFGYEMYKADADGRQPTQVQKGSTGEGGLTGPFALLEIGGLSI
jgi:hypothetical protein